MFLTIILIIIYLAFISLGLPDSLLGSAWPTMYTCLNVPITYAGIVSMIIAGGTIISSIFSNTLIKKLGSGLVTTISVLMTALALLGFSLSSKFYHLCIFAIFLGLGAGSIDAALNNFVALNYKAKHMNWLHAFWGIGATTGPIIMAYNLRNGNIYKAGYFTIALIQFTLVFILIITLPLWKKVEHKVDKDNNEKTPNNIKAYKLSGFYNVLIAFFCYCAIEATIGLWGSSFVVFVHGIKAIDAAKWASLFYFGITVGRILSGFLSIKLKNRKMIKFGLITIAVGILLFIIKGSNISLIAAFITMGIGCAPIFPSLLHQTPENFGNENSQKVMGLQMASAYVGTTFMPPLFGLLASMFGYEILIIYLAVLLLIMFIMIRILNKSVYKRNKEN